MKLLNNIERGRIIINIIVYRRIRLAFEAIFRKSATLQDVDPDPELGTRGSQDVINRQSHTPMLAPSPATSKKVQLVSKHVISTEYNM